MEGNRIQIDIFNEQIARSESNYQDGNASNYKSGLGLGQDGQSSMYSVPIDQDDDGTSYRGGDTVYKESFNN